MSRALSLNGTGSKFSVEYVTKVELPLFFLIQPASLLNVYRDKHSYKMCLDIDNPDELPVEIKLTDLYLKLRRKHDGSYFTIGELFLLRAAERFDHLRAWNALRGVVKPDCYTAAWTVLQDNRGYLGSILARSGRGAFQGVFLAACHATDPKILEWFYQKGFPWEGNMYREAILSRPTGNSRNTIRVLQQLYDWGCPCPEPIDPATFPREFSTDFELETQWVIDHPNLPTQSDREWVRNPVRFYQLLIDVCKADAPVAQG